jgi:hypothetical protein
VFVTENKASNINSLPGFKGFNISAEKQKMANNLPFSDLKIIHIFLLSDERVAFLGRLFLV